MDAQAVAQMHRPQGLPFRCNKIGHVALYVKDLERSAKFYTEVLGFQISDVYAETTMLPGGAVFLRCNADHHGIALFKATEGQPPHGAGLHHMAFEVSTLDEVLRARDHLRKHDVPIHFEGRRRAGVPARGRVPATRTATTWRSTGASTRSARDGQRPPARGMEGRQQPGGRDRRPGRRPGHHACRTRRCCAAKRRADQRPRFARRQPARGKGRSMGYWGKIIGGMAGFAMGGPFGAVVGAALGHAADTGARARTCACRSAADRMLNPARVAAMLGRRDQLFAICVVVLAAKLAKCDGPVKRAEIDAFKRQFRIPPEAVRDIGRLFDQARDSADGFEAYAIQLGEAFADNRGVLEDVLAALFVIARADGPVNGREQDFLSRAHRRFGLDQAAWDRARGAHAARPAVGCAGPVCGARRVARRPATRSCAPPGSG